MTTSTYKALMIFFAVTFAISLYGLVFTSAVQYLTSLEVFFDNMTRISFVMVASTIIAFLTKGQTKTHISWYQSLGGASPLLFSKRTTQWNLLWNTISLATKHPPSSPSIMSPVEKSANSQVCPLKKWRTLSCLAKASQPIQNDTTDYKTLIQNILSSRTGDIKNITCFFIPCI